MSECKYTIIINEAQNFASFPTSPNQRESRTSSNKQAYAGLLLGNQKRTTDDAQKKIGVPLIKKQIV